MDRPDLDPVPGGKGQKAGRATSRGHDCAQGTCKPWVLTMRSCLRPAFLGRGCEEFRKALQLSLLNGRARGYLSRSGVESHTFILPVTLAPCLVPDSACPGLWTMCPAQGALTGTGLRRWGHVTHLDQAEEADIRGSPTCGQTGWEPTGISALGFVSASGKWRERTLFTFNINIK